MPAFGCVVSTVLATLVLLAHFGGSAGAGALVDVYNGIILLATFTTLVPYAFCSMAELLLTLLKREHGGADRKRLRLTALIGVLAFVFAFFSIIGAGPRRRSVDSRACCSVCRSTSGSNVAAPALTALAVSWTARRPRRK